MQKVLATYRRGQVVLDEAVDWPEGTRIEVCTAESPASGDEERTALSQVFNDPRQGGLDESLWPKTAEGIELLLAHMDAAEPLDLTPDEQRTIEEAHKSDKQWQKEQMQRMWSDLENAG